MKNILALLFASFVLASGRRSSNPAAPSNTPDCERGRYRYVGWGLPRFGIGPMEQDDPNMAMKEVKRGKNDTKDKDAGESHRHLFGLGHVPKDDPSVAMKEVKRVKKDAKDKDVGESHRHLFGLGRVQKDDPSVAMKEVKSVKNPKKD